MKTNKVTRKKTISILMAATILLVSLLNIGVIFADDGATEAPPTEVPPTEAPPTEAPPTEVPPTEVPPTAVPPLPTEEANTGEVIPQDTTPTPESPIGVIYSNRPTYRWNKLDDATRYYLYVYRITMAGDVKLIDLRYSSSSICSTATDTCSVRPDITLPLGDYKWRLRVSFADGMWGDYSDFEYFTYASTTVTAKTPSGTIYEETPTFTWTELVGADQYQINVYNSKGVLVLNQVTEDFICNDSICSVESNETFVTGKYKWRVRGFMNAKWYAYSPYKSFTVASDIDSQFDSYDPNWARFAGASWAYSGGTLMTLGSAGKMTSARYAYTYNDFEIEASMKREGGSPGGSYPANYLCVRMASSKTLDTNLWFSGYLFGYTNAGTFSIWRMSTSGGARALQPWTESPSIVPNDWNTLRVEAVGSELSFYINDDLVHSFIDTNFTKGYVGVQAYRADSTQSRFWVDYVKLNRFTELATPALPLTISEKQAELNQVALDAARENSIEGYQVISQAIDTPTPYSPSGKTYEPRPRFTWESVDGATSYILHLSKSTVNGLIRVFGKTYTGSLVCPESSECNVISPVTLSPGIYQWKVRAYGDGAWTEYSEPIGFTVALPIPIGRQPVGTIFESDPEFVWTEIEGAERINIEVFNSAAIRTINLTSIDFGCADSLCSVLLDKEIKKGTYTWRVRVFLDGKWRAFSGLKTFTVGDVMDSDFNVDSRGWSSKLYGGNWTRSSGAFHTSGWTDKFTSTRYAYPYKDFIYEARVKREPSPGHSSQPANYMAVRMGSASRSTDFGWFGGYLFGYTNRGEFSVWRMSTSGGARILQPWTPSDAIVVDDWNILKVVAIGNDFEFYINDELVHSFTDSTYKQGYAGFQMYKAGTQTTRFMVDYARIEIVDATTLAAGETGKIDPDQLLLNQAALENMESTNNSITGSTQ